MNRNAVFPGVTTSVITSGDGVPSASAASPASRSPSTTARWSNAARIVARENATSAGSPVTSRRAVAWPRNAALDFADSTYGTTDGTDRTGVPVSCAGACSMIVCAFVPEMPNDDTAARHGRSTSGHAVVWVSSSTAPDDQSTCDDGSSMCRVLGNTPWRIARTILITPATPAAACVWPMFDFTDPSQSGRSRSWP